VFDPDVVDAFVDLDGRGKWNYAAAAASADDAPV
jgi:hypothetical protein